MILCIYLAIALVFAAVTHYVNQRQNPRYRSDTMWQRVCTLGIIGAIWPLALTYMLAPSKWTRKLNNWVAKL
jgi:hypothetical protein